MSWKDGYVAEVEYVRSFQRGLGPSLLNFVLMMNRIAPVPIHRGFTYCELGCGQGESLNLLASCHPEGSFHAIDFNPAHVSNARTAAQNAGLENATFWEADFADLAELPLQEFDFITLHGVYSWVNAAKRQHIVDFIRRKLKPGGVVYNGYNSLPGWAAHAPLRQLLASYGEMQSGTLLERVELSVDFVRQLKELDLAYFRSNPDSGKLFDTISSLPREYLAHDFFNRNWTPFYHADIVKDLVQAGLSFACSARLADFKDSLRFNPSVVRLLGTLSDPVFKETLKDFALNQQFRSDVFTKARPQLSGPEQLELLLDYRFTLVVPRDAAGLEIMLPGGPKQLLPALYEPILNALEDQSLSLEEIYQGVKGAGFGPAEVTEALVVLCAVEYIMPVSQPSPEAVATTGSYNGSILDQVPGQPERRFLASPLLKTGVPVSWPHLLLLLCKRTGVDDPPAFAWKHIHANRYSLLPDDAPYAEQENLTELRSIVDGFETRLLPMLRKLGVA